MCSRPLLARFHLFWNVYFREPIPYSFQSIFVIVCHDISSASSSSERWLRMDIRANVCPYLETQ